MSLASSIAGATAAARATWYVALNLVFSLITVIASFTGPGTQPRALYLCLLTAICSTPLLWMRELNGRYVLLSAFLAIYLFFYGANDFAALFVVHNSTLSRGVLSAAEFAVLLGGAVAVLGYHLALAQRPARANPKPARDYPIKLVIFAGLLFWAIGVGAVWIWQVKFQTTAVTLSKDFSATSILGMVIARMLEPLGTIMLAYAWVTTRSRTLLLLIVGLMLLQTVVGFVGDSKEIAMRGVIILIMGAFLIEGRIAKGWLAALVAFAVLVFPIFQAYRAEVMHMRGMSRAQAATDIMHSLKLALSAKDKVKANYNEDYAAPSFLERTALKPTIELLIAKTGEVAPFQKGYTLSLFFTGFVPRYFWPDKPDSSVGQLMNRQFHVSEDPNTYISATHLGEYYWNFGFPGIVVGMLGFGFLLGFVNTRCDLSERRTLTRLLILVTTIYATIVRFEGSISLEYIVYVRSLAIIGVMHLLFAKVPVAWRQGAKPGEPAGSPIAAADSAPLIHAPQLLR